MPELPDIASYLVALQPRIVGQVLEKIIVRSPFLLRTVEPDLYAFAGEEVQELSRIGKRIVWHFANERFFVFHLMIAGRFHWKAATARPKGKHDLAAFVFPGGSLMLTEFTQKKRVSLHVVQGREALRQFDRGGLEPLSASLEQFGAALARENHTLKHALADPRLFSGIGNAYSDEILFEARLSPVMLTSRLSAEQVNDLCRATRDVLGRWTERLSAEAGVAFPEKVTAFRKEMAVHGRYLKPCLVCGSSIQRIVYADNETNYCPRCQTGGKLLADRLLSRLLKSDWPKTIQEWEEERG